MYKRVSYYKELDGVRAIAALLVMCFHFSLAIKSSGQGLILIKKMAYFGQTGVTLFFVLSGFLITRILLKKKTEINYFSNFYVKRILRIFPLYYLYLIIFYFIIPLVSHVTIPKFSEQWYHWFYLQNFADTFNWHYSGPRHFWSLAVEEHFYLFFPLLIYYLNQKQAIIAVITMIVGAIAVRACLVMNEHETFYFTFSRMDDLAVGALLAFMELSGKLKTIGTRFFAYLLILTTLLTGLIWLVFNSSANPFVQLFKYPFISFTYFSFIGYIITIGDTSWLKKLLTSKAMRYTGKISYGLYVYHVLCFYYTEQLFGTDNLAVYFIICFGLSYIVSSLSYFLFENQFLKLKEKFERRQNEKSRSKTGNKTAIVAITEKP